MFVDPKVCVSGVAFRKIGEASCGANEFRMCSGLWREMCVETGFVFGLRKYRL